MAELAHVQDSLLLGLHSTNNNDNGFVFILCNMSIKAQAFSQTLLFSTDPKYSLGYSKNKKNTSSGENGILTVGYTLIFRFITIRKIRSYEFVSLNFELI